MAEFFGSPVVGFLLRAVDAFPADRDRANRKRFRTAIERLKEGRIVGLFPEGGIRDGDAIAARRRAAAAGRVNARAHRRRSDFAVRHRRQRSPLFD